jgi:hypothetical protein
MCSLEGQRCPGSPNEAVSALRSASGSVRNAINRVCDLAHDGETAGLVGEAREQLLAAMHLIDGVGVALRRVTL